MVEIMGIKEKICWILIEKDKQGNGDEKDSRKIS